MCVLSIKVPIRKKVWKFFNDPPIYIYIYINFGAEDCLVFHLFLVLSLCTRTHPPNRPRKTKTILILIHISTNFRRCFCPQDNTKKVYIILIHQFAWSTCNIFYMYKQTAFITVMKPCWWGLEYANCISWGGLWRHQRSVLCMTLNYI